MTNTIWESVSKMEDKDLKRDNWKRTENKLREIEDAEDDREAQNIRNDLKESAMHEANKLGDQVDKIKAKEDKKEKASDI